MAAALLALGSNLGDRQRILDDAVAQLAVQPNVVVLATSRWHSTRPVGGPPGQAEFLNGAVLLGTSLSPEQLHAVLRQVEAAAGRNREERWAPRTLDLDLLLYDGLVIDTPELIVPHPRMAFRRFVLEPAAEIAGGMRHPTIGWTIAKLREHLPKTRPRYIAAIAGPIAAGKTTLATVVVEALDGTIITDSSSRDGAFESYLGAAGLDIKGAKELLGAYLVLGTERRIPFMAISDFWFEQAVLSAEMTLPADQLPKYPNFYNSIAGRVLKPKLLVVLDAPPDVSWQRIAEGGKERPPTLDWLARYRKLLLERVAAPGHGPILRLDGTKPEEARDELIAAIQAMQ